MALGIGVILGFAISEIKLSRWEKESNKKLAFAAKKNRELKARLEY